jgi:hypothetical protein
MQALLSRARSRNVGVVIPAAVVAQVIRPGGRQADLRRFLSDGYLRFTALDYPTAMEIGSLLGASGTADVVDACVVACSHRFAHCPVVTSDPQDLRKLDPDLPLITV